MKSSVAMRFSAAAATYDEQAGVQRKAAERLMTLLENCRAPARILEIGCGTGVLTALLARAYPAARIEAVDVSPAMLAEARRKQAGNKKIKWIAADARGLAGRKKYPLIVSSCALHWIAPFSSILKRLARRLDRQGSLAFAVMTDGTLAELRACRERAAPHKPSRVVLPAADEIKNALVENGLKLLAAKTETLRQQYDSPEEILRQLHNQGLTGGNLPPGRLRAGSAENFLLTRAELARLMADYAANYSVGRKVYAGYQVFYGIAENNAFGY